MTDNAAVTSRRRLAIACAAGSLRGIFVHGALAGLAEAGLRADAYAAASSSALPAAFAAAGALDDLGGLAYWQNAHAYLEAHPGAVSEMILNGIQAHTPRLQEILFVPEVAPYVVATSAVRTAEAAAVTQGDGARRLGRRLLLATRTQDRGWAEANLALHLFGTLADPAVRFLTPANLEEVLYATTRMLHAWRVPAWIGGAPYVDASYTCSCPAVEMASIGYETVIAIVPEPGPVYRDIFGAETLPPRWGEAEIRVLQPEISLGEMGVDYLAATPEGAAAAYAHGIAQARAFALTLL